MIRGGPDLTARHGDDTHGSAGYTTALPQVFTSSLVSRVWFGTVAVLLVLGGAFANALILGVGLLLGATLGMAWLWTRYCLTGLTYERVLSPLQASWGEELLLVIHVTNNKPLPLAWLEIADEMPEEITSTHGHRVHPYIHGRAALTWRLGLGWYERVTLRSVLHCNRRGAYTFGPVTLSAGDIFGLFSRTMTVNLPEHLLVYPRVVPVTALGIPAREPFGDSRAVVPLVTDPLRPQGVRSYVPGDSPRFIHWRASARLGTLQTRVFDPASTPQVWIFCDQQTAVQIWEGIDEEAMELAIMVAASLAQHALDEGYAVALAANAFEQGSDQHVRLRPSTDPNHLTHILSTLARLTGWSGIPIELVLEGTRRTLPWGASIVVITAQVSDWLLGVLDAARRAGYPVTLVQVRAHPPRPGDAPVGDVGLLGITYYQVNGSGPGIGSGKEGYLGIEELALA